MGDTSSIFIYVSGLHLDCNIIELDIRWPRELNVLQLKKTRKTDKTDEGDQVDNTSTYLKSFESGVRQKQAKQFN